VIAGPVLLVLCDGEWYWVRSDRGSILGSCRARLGELCPTFAHCCRRLGLLGLPLALLVRSIVAWSIGLYSFTAFCTTLAFALPQLGIAAAFGLAVLACAATQLWLMRTQAPS
jgi:hypothetical protein